MNNWSRRSKNITANIGKVNAFRRNWRTAEEFDRLKGTALHTLVLHLAQECSPRTFTAAIRRAEEEVVRDRIDLAFLRMAWGCWRAA